MDNSETLERLIAAFSNLPSCGRRTAMRYAYAVLAMDEVKAYELSNLIRDAKDKVHACRLCGNYTENDICSLCSTRDNGVICVVGEVKDLLAIESAGDYDGVYHVLGGTLNPRKRIGIAELGIERLMARLDGVREVILATNPSPEGEVTALHLAGLIKPRGIKVTRIAYGLPVGGNIEYADEVTLGRALRDRKEL